MVITNISGHGILNGVFMGLLCGIRKGNRAGYGTRILT